MKVGFHHDWDCFAGSRGLGETMPEASTRLRSHSMQLVGEHVRLRPLTEHDWPHLLRWNQDPRVLFYSDGGRTAPWSLEKLQVIYRGISEHAFIFLIERGALPIGECWLQEMNLERIRAAFPRDRIYRIDLAIGDPALWGHGLGTEAIGLLVKFAFRELEADAVFACHVSEANPRSQRAFAKNGFEDWGATPIGELDRGGPPARDMWLPRPGRTPAPPRRPSD